MCYQLMPIVLARLYHVVEVGARLHHCRTANSLSNNNHYNARCDDPRWVDVRLVAREELRDDNRLGKGHSMGHSVLVAVGKKERGNVSDRGIVCRCRVELEEVEKGERAEE